MRSISCKLRVLILKFIDTLHCEAVRIVPSIVAPQRLFDWTH